MTPSSCDLSQAPFRGLPVPPEPTLSDIRAVIPDYQAIVQHVMTALADRYDRDPGYPYIDTKLDLITGEDFAPDDPIRGREVVYGWIQGRGLEALAGHVGYLRRHPPSEALVTRLERMMREILARLRDIRGRNNGRLFFFMTPEGVPFALDGGGKPVRLRLTSETPCGFSDLFCAKGMLAAAHELGDRQAEAEALQYVGEVDEAIWNRTFRSDQQPLDPRNPVQAVPGRFTHGHYMIQIGAAALRAELLGDPESVEMGIRLIRHELTHHVNLRGRIPDLLEHDFWEAVDDRGLPWREGGVILSDPGHALECVGLTLRFAAAVKRLGLASPSQAAEIAEIEEAMPDILARNFANGFRPGPGGICKAFDLVARAPLNTDMPWWNLPETIRAAARCWGVAKDEAGRALCLGIFRECHNAFVRHYLRPDLHLMAYQTRSAEGHPVPVIPATADADPGYHTGLSLIDALNAIGTR